jgi:asparagine synthase (glutamine-hydrolysing)
LFKDALRPWLPDSILDRPKQGFGVPIAMWFRGQLRSMPGAILLDPTSRARGMFRPEYVEALIADHQSGARDNAHRIWALIQLELWQRTFVDSLASAPLDLDIAA